MESSTIKCTICGSMTLPCQCPYLKNVEYPAPSQRYQQRIAKLEAALIKARDALATCSTGMCDQKFDTNKVNEALTKINEVL